MLTNELKEILGSNICYFATSTKDGMPNVIPVGLVEPIDDSRILIVDVKMNKTRKNLRENEMVAIAVTDVEKLRAYQLKGRAKVVTSGDLFERAVKLVKEKMERRRRRLKDKLEKEDDPEIRKKLEEMMKRELTPKAAIIIEVKEIYPCM
ncbi:pyridoxamine 5'-phosphate oxidase family protein [Archaeoglobus sp.]